MSRRHSASTLRMLRGLLAVVGRRRNGAAILKAWEYELRGVDPLQARLIPMPPEAAEIEKHWRRLLR